MKKAGLVITAVVFGVGVGAAIAVYHSWQQATRLPEWYSAQTVVIDDAGAEAAKNRVMRRLMTTSADQNLVLEGELSSTDLNDLVVGTIASSPSYRPILEGTKGFNTTIQDGTLQSGAVVNLSEIPASQLGAGEQAVIERIATTFPGLAERDIYVGIEGQPSFVNGELRFDSDTAVRLGDLRLTISQLSSLLGVSQQEIEQHINQRLQSQQLNLEQIQFEGDRAIIRGALQGVQ